MKSVYLFFLAACLVAIQCLIGGTRLLFAIPAYALLSLGAILSILSIRARQISVPDPLCIGATLALGGWVLLRAWQSPVAYLGWPDFFMMMACLMAYLITAFYLHGPWKRVIFIAVLWAIALAEVLVGLIQFTKDQAFMPFDFLKRQVITRASGMFISPNHFAGYLETVAIISVSMGVWSRWRVWAKMLAFYIAACCWLGVAVSGSRGSYFSVIGSLLAFAGASIYTIRLAAPRKFVAVTIAALGGTVAVVALAAFFMAHSALLTGRMNSMVKKDVRLYNWEAALDHFHVSPWIGTGGGTHLIYGRMFRRPQIQADPIHAHCDYLELIAEYGVVGALCMALFLSTHVWSGLRGLSEFLHRRLIPSGLCRSDAFAMQLGALCAVVALAIHSIFDFNMHIPGNAIMFAFIFGVLANPGTDRPRTRVDRWILPVAQWLLPVLGGWMLYAGIPLLPTEWCVEQSRVALRDNNLLKTVDFAERGLGKAPPEPEWIDTWVRRLGPDPRNPYLYFYEGEAYRGMALRMKYDVLRQKFYQRALAAFQDGLKVFPGDEDLLLRMSQTLDGLHRYPEADASYKAALRMDPNFIPLYSYYADHLKAVGKNQEAQAALKRQNDLLQEGVGLLDPGSQAATRDELDISP